MANPFYSMEEVCQKLGKTESEVKELVRDGSLREFRDGGKIFFKAEDVDRLAGGADDTGEITLAPVDDEVPSIADASSGTSIIGLSPLTEEPASEEPKKEDNAIASSSGMGVFDDDDLDVADPMAATQVTDSPIDDQVQLDSSGSGSGLLDLTREADDTSLGTEVLDDILPSAAEEQAEPTPAKAKSAAPAEPVAKEPIAPVAPIAAMSVQSDPSEGIMSGILVGILLLTVFSGIVATSVVANFVPNWVVGLISGSGFWIVLAVAVGVLVISALAGWLLGGAMSRR